MKRILPLLALLIAACGAIQAQTGCTPGNGVTCSPTLNLWLLPQHYQNWGVPWNDNATAVDTFAASTVIFTPLASQAVTQPSGTLFEVSNPQVFGAPSTLRFGAVAGTADSSLTRTAAGTFSLDSGTVANGLGTLNLGGILVAGATGTSGQCLSSDGTAFNTPANCITSLSGLFYQTVDANGTAQTQRPVLNFSTRFALADTASPARTTVDLASVVSAGSCTYCTVAFDIYGRASSYSTGASPTGTNFYNTVSGCVPSTSTDSGCTGTLAISPAMADTSYYPFLSINSNNGAFLAISVSGGLSTASIPYTITCTFNCSSIVTPTIYVYAHHN